MSEIEQQSHTLAIVDDEEALRETYRVALESSFNIVEFESADDAIAKLDMENLPDVFLSDLRMPGRNGIEFLRWMREQGVDHPFVILSGYAEKEDALEAMKYGAFSLIEKPCNLVELFLTLSRASAFRLLQQISDRMVGRHQDLIQSLEAHVESFNPEVRNILMDAKDRSQEVIALLDRYRKLYKVLENQEK